ncbi:MAG: hypothetical protein JXA03_15470 [Bacteroidales bacterium]|nr:hypothetical protein [Bacteroidales bacterium]
METIRYTGEDIPVDITMTDTDGAAINPTELAGIKVYVCDKDQVILKAAEPAEPEYEELIVNESFVRLWIESSVTAELAGKKLHFEVAIYETEAALSDGLQTTIAVSDKLLIKNALIKAEEQTIPEEN